MTTTLTRPGQPDDAATRRETVARAMYRHSRISEAEQAGKDDPVVYAGWFPWENLGSGQASWLASADIALSALAEVIADGERFRRAQENGCLNGMHTRVGSSDCSVCGSCGYDDAQVED